MKQDAEQTLGVPSPGLRLASLQNRFHPLSSILSFPFISRWERGMEPGSVGIVTPQDFVFGETPDDRLSLDCGKSLGPVTLRFETYGTLNPARNNAVLLLHALSGDAHVAGQHHADDRKAGWWDEMVGPGKAFDTGRYFVVCSNVIGGCSGSTGPRSLNPATGRRYNLEFPIITVADMVRAQHRLMRHLGIDRWLAVVGGSMGGMQALEWVVNYPEAVGSAIPIATTARLSSQSIAFNWVGRQAIMNDPAWCVGGYEEAIPEQGLAIARMIGHITYLSDRSMDSKFGRRLQASDRYAYDFARDFEVESYLEYQGQRFVERFDANSYLYITRAMDYFDLSARGDGDLTQALAPAKACPFLVVSFSSDWLFPPYQSKEIVRALRNNHCDVTYCNIDSMYGHDAFLLEAAVLGRMIGDFLRCRHEEADHA
jgi:homoserine O-acetyltransferase